MLLQRTRAEQVVPVYEEFARRYPDPVFLVRESLPEFRRLVRPLGLHWRAPLMRAMANEVSRRGALPDDLPTLLELPGVGPYAAGAYLSMHRGRRALIIDSNIVRWLSRVFGFRHTPETRRQSWLKKLVDDLTPKRKFRDFNYAMLDLSMTVCRAKPECNQCPLSKRQCAYSRSARLR